MTSVGFFTQLFNQFVALITAFCVNVPGTPVERFAEPDTGPPPVVAPIESQLVQRQDPLLQRVIETQIQVGIELGRAFARSADRGTFALLDVPSNLAEALNRGGIAALPGGVAQSGKRVVAAIENSAVDLIRAFSDAILAELALVPGMGDVRRAEVAAEPRLAAPGLVDPRQPLLVRVVTTQINGAISIGTAVLSAVAQLGAAILAAPGNVAAVVARGGLITIPAGLATAAREIVLVATEGAVGVVTAVGDLAEAELDLIPGGVFGDPRAEKLLEPRMTSNPILQAIELAVRLPVAIGVAAADLAMAGLEATTELSGGVVTAATDVVSAAVNPRSEETVVQALGRAPTTVLNGARDATETLQGGFTRAATNFSNTLNPRQVETRVSASGGLNTSVNGSQVTNDATVNTTVTSTGTTGNDNNNQVVINGEAVIDEQPVDGTVTTGEPVTADTGVGADATANVGSSTNEAAAASARAAQ